jgi:predicted 2-oxoglutarate/Fe(II)-dependent dioxygenase YbiX
LTLHLGGDKPWLIWIKTPEGEDRSVELNPGDAMMYRGTIAEHWRDEYVGEEYVQVFLHYVRSRGECAYTYFDTENHKGEHGNHNKKITIDKTLEVEVKEDTIKRSPILIKPASKLEDFVQVFDNVLSPENCNLILDEYKNTSEWDDTRTGDGQVSKNIRNCMEIGLSLNQVLEQNFDVRKNLDNIVFESVRKVIENYNALVPTFRVDIDTGYQLLRYKEGEFYIQHTDSFKEQQRSLSCSIQLNEDYEGGEFAFFDREMMIRTKPGSAIVFPSNFMYPHEIMPVIKGTRYSIITWLV